MIELIKQPWHWSIAGILIGLTVPALLLMGNKKFGISSSLTHLCAMCLPLKIPFFQYDWKKEIWNLYFVTGILIGGFIAGNFLTNPNVIVVADSTKAILTSLGINDYSQIMPVQIFSIENIFTLKGLFFFVIEPKIASVKNLSLKIAAFISGQSSQTLTRIAHPAGFSVVTGFGFKAADFKTFVIKIRRGGLH